MKIASGRSDGVRCRSRVKMVKRLFFDRIGILADSVPINQRVKFAFLVLPDFADTQLPLRDHTAVGAQVAPHLVLGNLLIEQGFFHDLHPPLAGCVQLFLLLNKTLYRGHDNFR